MKTLLPTAIVDRAEFAIYRMTNRPDQKDNLYPGSVKLMDSAQTTFYGILGDGRKSYRIYARVNP
jgi:hypothetical protein